MQNQFCRVSPTASENRKYPLRVVRRTKCALHYFSFLSSTETLKALQSCMKGLPLDVVLIRLVKLGPNIPKASMISATDLAELAKELSYQTCTVVRYEQPESTYRVPLRMLVPGDIVRLSAGDYVPADLRLLVNDKLVLERAILQPWHDVCAMGDHVLSGCALAIVVATGNDTLLGMLMQTPEQRPSITIALLTAIQRRVARSLSHLTTWSMSVWYVS